MDTKVNYAGITRRVVAYIVDAVISLLLYALFYLLILFILSGESLPDFFSGVFSGTDSVFMSVQCQALETLLFVVLETLMITKFGWTPGKLLCGIRVKDANTLENVSLMQAVIRSTLKALLLVPGYISEWFLILPILALIPAIFDQRKQFFYDKIAKTVVMDCESEECHLNVNYVGIIRRIIACIVDHFIIMGICIVYFSFVKMIFDPYVSGLLTICLYFLLSIVLGIFMIRRFGGTPGQLLCCICIKDVNTLESITLVQAIIRYVLFKILSLFLLGYILIIGKFSNRYISELWFIPLSNSIFMIIILIIIFVIISAIFDKRKQLLHDKIAKTVAIDYKPSS